MGSFITRCCAPHGGNCADCGTFSYHVNPRSANPIYVRCQQCRIKTVIFGQNKKSYVLHTDHDLS